MLSEKNKQLVKDFIKDYSDKNIDLQELLDSIENNSILSLIDITERKFNVSFACGPMVEPGFTNDRVTEKYWCSIRSIENGKKIVTVDSCYGRCKAYTEALLKFIELRSIYDKEREEKKLKH